MKVKAKVWRTIREMIELDMDLDPTQGRPLSDKYRAVELAKQTDRGWSFDELWYSVNDVILADPDIGKDIEWKTLADLKA